MLIDPIDSVRLIQSLQAQSHPAPFSSHPHRQQFIILSHTLSISPIQGAAYKYIHYFTGHGTSITLLLPCNNHSLL